MTCLIDLRNRAVDFITEQVVLDFNTSVQTQLKAGRPLLDAVRDSLYVAFGSQRQFEEAKGRMQATISARSSPVKLVPPPKKESNPLTETKETVIRLKKV